MSVSPIQATPKIPHFHSLPKDVQNAIYLMAVHSGTPKESLLYMTCTHAGVKDDLNTAKKDLISIFQNEDRLNLFIDLRSRSYLMKAILQFKEIVAENKENLRTIMNSIIDQCTKNYKNKAGSNFKKFPVAEFIEFLLRNPRYINDVANTLTIHAKDISYGPFSIKTEDSICVEKTRTGLVRIYLNKTNPSREKILSIKKNGYRKDLNCLENATLIYDERDIYLGRFTPTTSQDLFEVSSHGIFQYSNGDTFTGTVKESRPYKGIMEYKNGGTLLTNAWEDIKSCDQTDSLDISSPVKVEGTFPTIQALETKSPQTIQPIKLTLVKNLDKETKNPTFEGNFDFRTGAFCGIVKFTSAEGSTTTQLWLDNRLQKRQDYQSETVKSYYGTTRDGLPNGYGLIQYINGDEYVGELSSGQPSGQGQMTYSTGDIYRGNFSEGKRHGQGHFGRPGHKYSGEWRNNFFFNGTEVVQFGNGTVQQRLWKDGKLVQ
jgi:hypothetical protein